LDAFKRQFKQAFPQRLSNDYRFNTDKFEVLTDDSTIKKFFNFGLNRFKQDLNPSRSDVEETILNKNNLYCSTFSQVYNPKTKKLELDKRFYKNPNLAPLLPAVNTNIHYN
jgi:hypothetical protein